MFNESVLLQWCAYYVVYFCFCWKTTTNVTQNFEPKFYPFSADFSGEPEPLLNK